ncbi:MAG TPA: phosphoglycerate mutase family protein [Pyrinomonadaceae bacterium]|jgi:broad specificity phosphatase PhoE
MANGTAPTIVIMVRHGDRNTPTRVNPDTNPHLNTAGKDRALILSGVLSRANVKAVYTSNTFRSKETAEPLATKLRLSPTVIDEVSKVDEALKLKNDILSNNAGKTVLVVGHTDTIPELIRQLGGENMPDIDDKEFDNLFVVTVFSPGKASVTKLKYGKPTP